MKASYLAFINQVSSNKINLFNRPLFRGFFSRLDDEAFIAKGLEDLRDVKAEFTSDYYKQLISSWSNV